MDAKTLLDWFTNAPEGSQSFYAIPEAGRATLRSALELAAAVEGPEEATPETDAIRELDLAVQYPSDLPGVLNKAIDLLDTLERQRNAALRALKAERERCAKEAEWLFQHHFGATDGTAIRLASAIREGAK